MPFSRQAHFAGCSAQQVHRRMLDCGKIGSGIAGSDATFVLSEGHSQNPVQAVFHLPMIADIFCQGPGFSLKRRDMKSRDRFGLAPCFTCVFGHDHGFQAGPLVTVPDPFGIRADRGAPRLNAPMISVDDLNFSDEITLDPALTVLVKKGSVYELYAWTCDGGCEASPG